MNMKIYFAGSIRSGRRDQPYQKIIIEILQKYGQVLTVHIGRADLPQWGESGITDRQIYRRDKAWLISAAVLVAEISTPSIGVGFEIGLAQSRKKPILCLYRSRPGNRLTPMVAGNPSVVVKKYRRKSDLPAIIDQFIKRSFPTAKR